MKKQVQRKNRDEMASIKSKKLPKKKPKAVDVKAYMAAHDIPDPKLPKELKKASPKAPTPVAPSTKELVLRKIKTTFRIRQDTMINKDRIGKRITTYTREDGSRYIPPFDDDEKREFELQQGMYEGLAAQQTKQLEVCLNTLPIWTKWLRDVPGMGANIGAPLLGNIRFENSEKPGNLIQFCGVGFHVDEEGKFVAQRKRKGQILDYCEEIRRALWSFGSVIQKGKNLPAIKNSKYYKIYVNKYNGMLAKYQLPTGGIEKATTEQKALYAKASTAARRLMCRVLVEDIYFVGRAYEGLPIWPDYYAAKLGYAHGGKIVRNEPISLNPEDAIKFVLKPIIDWTKLQKAAE